MSKEPLCPLLNKVCIEGRCKFWVHLLGKHPSTGAPIDSFDCAVAWLPVMLVENTRHTIGVQAAVESARNEIVKRQDVLNAAIEEKRNETHSITYNSNGTGPTRIGP